MKKWISVVLGLTLSVCLLAGCGSTGNTANTNAGQANVEEVNVEPKELVTLKFMHWTDSASENMYAELVKSFETVNSDVKVELVKSDIKTYDEKLTVTLTGGSDIDAFAFKNLENYYKYASTGRLPALDDQIKTDANDLKGVSNKFDVIKVNDKVYGLPFRNDVWALYYNKKLFDDAGVAYPKDDMTWEEYLVLAKQMTKGEGQDKVWGSFMPDWAQTWYGYGHQLGKNVFDEDLTPFLQGLKLRKELSTSGSQPSVAENKATNAHYRTAFLTGKYAMVITGTWFPGMLEQDLKDGKLNFDWDMTYVPHPPGVQRGTSMSTPVVHSINNDSKHKDEAYAFIKFIASEEGQKIVAKFQTPASTSADVKDVFTKSFTKPVNLSPIFDAIPVPERVLKEGLPQLGLILEQEGNRALLDDITPEEALVNIKDRRSKEIQ